MKIFVLAKPNSNREEIKKIDSNHFFVAVKEPPVSGRANKAILKLLSGYFGVSLSRVRMIHGHTAGQKVIEITEQ